MLTLLTPTGMRPLAWSICETLMAAQDYQGPVRWIVVDDGTTPLPIRFARPGWSVEVIRPREQWRPGANTQASNLRAGLAVIPDDARVAVIEDDDYYGPRWLSTVADRLERAEMVGETRARYYNIATSRYRVMSNTRHASLSSTAVRGRALAALRRVCVNGVRFIDLDLWKQPATQDLFAGDAIVSIKGMPGRPGIGVGHRDTFGRPDPEGAVLRAWLGNGAMLYEPLRGATSDHEAS